MKRADEVREEWEKKEKQKEQKERKSNFTQNKRLHTGEGGWNEAPRKNFSPNKRRHTGGEGGWNEAQRNLEKGIARVKHWIKNWGRREGEEYDDEGESEFSGEEESEGEEGDAGEWDGEGGDESGGEWDRGEGEREGESGDSGEWDGEEGESEGGSGEGEWQGEEEKSREQENKSKLWAMQRVDLPDEDGDILLEVEDVHSQEGNLFLPFRIIGGAG